MLVNKLFTRNMSGKLVSIAIFLVAIAAFTLSLMMFLADRYAAAAQRILDNPETVEADLISISRENMPTYREGLRALKNAIILAPLNSEYPRSLADVYMRINAWGRVMQTMKVGQVDGLLSGSEVRDGAMVNARKAVALDPANANDLLLLAQLCAADGDRESARGFLMKAIQSYPVNGTVRYAAAMQMLMMGMDKLAGEQARLLAEIDDSYRLDGDDSAVNLMRVRRMPDYAERLARSYLYKAMEITWRTSSRNPKAVLAIVPDNSIAQEVQRVFFERKGIVE